MASTEPIRKEKKEKPTVGDSIITIGGGGGMVPDKVKVKFSRRDFIDNGRDVFELVDERAISSVQVYVNKRIVFELPINAGERVDVNLSYPELINPE